MVAFSGLPAATTFGESDIFAIEQGGVSKQLTKTQLRSLLLSDPAFAVPLVLPQSGDVISYNGTDFIAGVTPRWRIINPAAYAIAEVRNSSEITFGGGTSPSSGIYRRANDYFSVGTPVRVVISGNSHYGICTAVSNTVLTISGASLPTGIAIGSLAVGSPDMVKTVQMSFADATYNASSTLTLTKGCRHLWTGPTGILVGYSCAHMNTSSTTVVNLQMNGGSNVSAAGVIPAAGTSTTYGAFVSSALGDLIRANLSISHGQTITAKTTTVGTLADYLIICMTFVVP